VALASAGLVLYFPANFFPVLTVSRLGQGSPSTILSGVWELLAAGQAPLAAIVFLASVAVPVFKLIGLGAMVLIVVRGPSTHLRRATILYRIVALIGRWSMIDIFMESILNALVKFGAAAEIDPGQGAIAFAAVVILTMISAERFDPRLMWDRQAA
jgi:paraquat-inducible protein A